MRTGEATAVARVVRLESLHKWTFGPISFGAVDISADPCDVTRLQQARCGVAQYPGGTQNVAIYLA